MPEAYQLAQINIGRVRAPIGDPLMEGFTSRLDEINALAESMPGFVWRLQTPEGNATSIHVYDDPYLLINMSVWESIDTLWNFAYKAQHAEIMSKRKQWFEPMDIPYMVLWWIPAGHIPTPQEAKERLDMLMKNGPTPEAFTFKQRFPAPVTEA